MRLLLDHDLPDHIRAPLRAAGHDAVHAAALGLTPGDHGALIARARDEGFVIVSRNRDLESLVSADIETSPSLILIVDFNVIPIDQLGSVLVADLSTALHAALAQGAIAFIDADRIKVRLHSWR